jgi:ribosomal protein S18 acetylase RimI-like enzyme
VAAAALGDYVAAFRRRARALGPDVEVVDEPGLVGFGTREGHPGARALVLDDRSTAALEDLLARVPIGVVSASRSAPRARELLAACGYGGMEPAAAMVRSDLDGLPDLRLARELTPSRVQRTPDEPPGVPFDDAVAAVLRFDPSPSAVPEAAIRAFLLSLPAATLLAAVDESGTVRATAASGAYGEDAVVVMVSTDPSLRGRGIGSAMTAHALRAAKDNGAVRACLASDIGEPIYRRLGFTKVAELDRFIRPG